MKENLKNKTKTSNIAPGRWISLAGEIEERRMKKEKKTHGQDQQWGDYCGERR